ncbi:MAG: cytochrome c biogenesis protein DipZ [Thermoleophilia bacterium]|nr:cytochrome c biogenesis protein DipZ [Thermoleophilia bacterium]MDH3725204.1 cytochrome c biogenesis protein DipZ [Thermoleophilia bacterium]
MLVLVFIAFIAGIATALAPCVLPALPVVIAGASTGGPRRPIGIGLGLVISFTVFTLGLSTALRGIGLGPDALRNIAIGGLLIFGLVLLVPMLDRRMSTALNPVSGVADRLPKGGDGLGGGVLLGGALGLAWTPCAGPILAGITATISALGAGVEVALVLFFYALGAAIPLVLIAYGGRALVDRLSLSAGPVRRAMGALMVIAAVLILAGLDTRLTASALEDVPGYEASIQALERSDTARDRLAELQDLPTGPAPLTEAARGTEAAAGDDLGLPNAGPAPELRGISAWFNSEPLQLAELRGKVVLVDFWTYSCINCVRTLPHLRAWDREYRDDGLVIVGVHTPEFAFEAEPGNVEEAIDDLEVTWPVALDPEFATWRAYRNQFWPAKYLIDTNGDVRDLHVGEGAYEETETLIRRLLGVDEEAETASSGIPTGRPQVGHGTGQTPETYLGYERIARFASPTPIARDRVSLYAAPFGLREDELAYRGEAVVAAEHVAAGPGGATIHLNFLANDLFLVMESTSGPQQVAVRIDGDPVGGRLRGDDVVNGEVTVDASRLYSLARIPGRRERHRLEVALPAGVRAFAFTFG